MKKHIVVVLGMHRSGTSAITRGLSVIGVDLGQHLIDGVSGDNDKGFFEDLDVNLFNNELLYSLGHDWHTLTPILPEELTGSTAQSYKLRAVTLLRTKLESADLFGLKEPRVTRLLPFWQGVFEQLQVQVTYVIACRNPLSVSRSLAKRDGFDPVKGYYLWLDYMLSSFTHTAGQNRIVVDYDNMMDDPAGELKRVADCLGLGFDPASQEMSLYQNQFLEGSLQHTRFKAEDLALEKAVPGSVTKFYLALQELATDRVGFDNPQLVSLLSHLQELLLEMRPAFSYMRSGDDKATKLDLLVGERAAHIATLNQAVAERDGKVASLTEAFNELHGQITERDLQITSRDAQIRMLDQRITELTGSYSWRITTPLRWFAKGIIKAMPGE